MARKKIKIEFNVDTMTVSDIKKVVEAMKAILVSYRNDTTEEVMNQVINADSQFEY